MVVFLPLQEVQAAECGTRTAKIDEMLLAKAKAKGLTFNPPAEPATLVRRMYFGSHGTSPTPEELQSTIRIHRRRPNYGLPAFGERWAPRHWLDVARFAESTLLQASLMKSLPFTTVTSSSRR